MKIRAIQYVNGEVKYDEVYEGFELDELVGAVIDSYEIEIID